MTTATYEVRVTEHAGRGERPYEWGIDFDTRRDAVAWVSSVTADEECTRGLIGIDFSIRPKPDSND